MKLFEKLQNNLISDPDCIWIQDKDNAYSICDVDRITGQVYAYLKNNSIGKEDIVMIYMPRCAEALCVFFGILRAGACAVIVDADASKDYVDYFVSDANPTMIINSDVYRSIISMQPLNG